MDKAIPKRLLNSRYRREMWDNTQEILKKLEKALPVSSVYMLGSFTTKKRRPADADLILMLQAKGKSTKSNWSVDLVICPDNKFGDDVIEDTKKWMKQKYGTKGSAVVKLK